METALAPRPLPVVGGHLALDFANTVDDPDGPARWDHLGTYPSLLEWASQHDVLTAKQARKCRRLVSGRPRDAARAVRSVQRFRGDVAALFTTVAAGTDPTQSWRALRVQIADAVAQAETSTDGSFTWRVGDDPAALVRPIAYAALELFTGADLDRVKKCGGCPWLFVDRSRNGSRRWCAMGDCGTHEKIQRYVARRAAAREAAH